MIRRFRRGTQVFSPARGKSYVLQTTSRSKLMKIDYSPLNRRAFKPRTVAFLAVLTFASTTLMWADLYSPGPNTTDLQGQWINATTSPPGGPPVYGTPGPADDVDLQGFDITASGGSVRSIYDLGSLTVTGMASAVEASTFILRGSGTLSVASVDPTTG